MEKQYNGAIAADADDASVAAACVGWHGNLQVGVGPVDWPHEMAASPMHHGGASRVEPGRKEQEKAEKETETQRTF